ncbi:hypothetical protein SDC9_205667 [bioreactor metagenome]|uniref:Uncharacterized protein n=1 Tax=bioreactor metagenome TaxID=1076179 RepID=A0A645J2Y3_9ZZZZ
MAASTHAHHVTQHGSLNRLHLSTAFTDRASFHLGTGFCSIATTGLTILISVNLDFLLDPEITFIERNI